MDRRLVTCGECLRRDAVVTLSLKEAPPAWDRTGFYCRYMFS